MKRLLVVVAAVMALCGCGAEDKAVNRSEDATTIEVSQGLLGYRVARFVDREAGVVCYLSNGTGLACVPLSETTLDAADAE